MRNMAPLATSEVTTTRRGLVGQPRSRAARFWRGLARFSFGFVVGALVSVGSSSVITSVTGGLGGLLALLFPRFVQQAFDRVPNWLVRVLDAI